MDYEFESIIPWNGEHDTGRDARQKLDRNFAKIKANFKELGDAKFVTTAFFARIFGIDGEDDAQVDINDTEAVITAVKVKFGLYSESFVSAKGKNPESGSEPGGATTLAALTDVSITTTPKDGQVLAYDATLNKWTPVDMEATAGIDEEELLQILTQKGYATQTWVTQQSYAKTSVRIKAGTGLAGGGTLAQGVTLSLATVGTAGTYTKVTVDSYGRVTGHSSLTQGDIPALAISKITGLQTTLDAKLNKSVFEELFEKVWVSGYGYAIRAKLAFYSDDWISAKGLNSDAGSTTGGVDENEVLQIVKDAGYATQDWVRNRGYLTSAALSGYLTQSTADGLYYHGHGETDDFNNAVMGGAYLTRSEAWPDNGPSAGYKYGVLAVFYSGVDNARIGQLWMSHQGTGGIFARVKFDTNDGSWSTWRRLMDDTCIGSYALTPSNYTNYTVTKTGAGASGTWGIGISGNAATASVASKLGTATVGANNHAIYLLNGVPTKCTYAFGNYSGNVPISNGTTNANLSADMLDGKHGTDYYRIKEYNNVGIAKSMSSINATNASANAWNRADNASLFIQNSNNAFVVTLGGTTNDRNANIQVGHADYSSFATILGTLYLNRLGGAVCVGNPDTAAHHLNVGGGMYASSYVQIGSARLYYDSGNNALYVQKSDGTQCGFYATGFVSAKGANGDAGSVVEGASALSELEDVTISSPVNGQALVYRNGYWRNEMVSGGGSAAVNWDDIQGKPTWIPDTDGSGSGIDADLLDGTHKSGLFTAMTYSGSTLSITIGGTKRTATINASGGGASSVSVSSSSSRNISVTVDGHTDYVNDVYATYSTYADQLRTARTIWGQSFNGGGSVSGAMSGVTNINMSGTITLTGGCTIHNNSTRGGIVMTYNGNDDGACLVIEADCVRRGWNMDTYALGSSVYRWHTIYAVNSLNTSSDLRLKDILSDIPLTVEQVAAAPSFLYRWKNSKDTAIHAGSAAQYWQKALPQAVLKGEDGYLSMEYDRLALAAVITTARTVVDHEQRIRRLEDALKVAV